MANKETIERVNNELRYGDKGEIATITGLSKVTVNRFFNGKSEDLVDDTHNKIMDAALIIIEDRQRRAKAIEQRATAILQ
jgi:DNA-binding LacI/PurR family transcriptional regulator